MRLAEYTSRQCVPILVLWTVFAWGCASSELEPEFDSISGDGGVSELDTGGQPSGPGRRDAAMGSRDSQQIPFDTDDRPQDDASQSRDMLDRVDVSRPSSACETSTEKGWTSLGRPLRVGNESSVLQGIDVASDEQCRPVVSWLEQGTIYNYRLVDGDWSEMGEPIDELVTLDPSSLRRPSGLQLAEREGELALGWIDRDDDEVAPFAYQWTGSSWESLGETPAINVMSHSLAVALDEQSLVWLAWAEAGSGVVVAHQTEEQKWEVAGTPLYEETETPLLRVETSLLIDEQNRPIVAWAEASYIYLRRWDGRAWVDYAGGRVRQTGTGVLTPTPSNPSLVNDERTGDVFLTFSQRNQQVDVHLLRWREDAWLSLGQQLNDPLEGMRVLGALNPAIALDPFGQPVVAWNEPISPLGRANHIVVQQWKGEDYQGLGPVDAVSGNANGIQPQLARDSSGRVLLAWQEQDAQGVYRVHVSRYSF